MILPNDTKTQAIHFIVCLQWCQENRLPDTQDDLNWYAYCSGNPIAVVDSWGLEDIVIANAGWSEEQFKAIEEGAKERGINLLWFSSTEALINCINEGRERNIDPITSIYVFAHGTDADADGNSTGHYAITFGLYTDKDEQLRMYTQDISNINTSAFSGTLVSYFYACRTGNDFNNGNFAKKWADYWGQKHGLMQELMVAQTMVMF